MTGDDWVSLCADDVVVVAGGFGQTGIVQLYESLRAFYGSAAYGRVVVLGICLGYQLMSASNGGRSEEWTHAHFAATCSLIGAIAVHGPDGFHHAIFRNSYGVFAEAQAPGPTASHIATGWHQCA